MIIIVITMMMIIIIITMIILYDNRDPRPRAGPPRGRDGPSERLGRVLCEGGNSQSPPFANGVTVPAPIAIPITVPIAYVPIRASASADGHGRPAGSRPPLARPAGAGAAAGSWGSRRPLLVRGRLRQAAFGGAQNGDGASGDGTFFGFIDLGRLVQRSFEEAGMSKISQKQKESAVPVCAVPICGPSDAFGQPHLHVVVEEPHGLPAGQAAQGRQLVRRHLW